MEGDILKKILAKVSSIILAAILAFPCMLIFSIAAISVESEKRKVDYDRNARRKEVRKCLSLDT